MNIASLARRIATTALVLALAPMVWAQSRTSSAVTGIVKGQDGGIVTGATVTIESPQLIGGARSTVTDSKGQYRFQEIAPGTYTVSVVMPGYKTLKREEVRLPVGITLDLPLSITQFAGEETVTVTGEPPPIDVTSPETKTVLTNDYLNNIPASQFQPDTLNLAPGITDTVAWGGAADTGVAWAIDGVDTSDPEAGSAWSFVNYNIIDEVELAGLGAPAEYGGFTGVMFNSTTKSGSNDFHGLVDAYFANDSFVTDNDAPAGVNPTLEKYINTTANMGGPFIKDKLWWFASVQYYNEVSSNGGPDRDEESPRVFTKLTWQINPNNLFDAWVEWDRYDIIGRGGDVITPLEATVREDAPEFVWNFSWKRVFNKDTVLNVTFQGYDGYFYLDPENGYDIAGRYDAFTGLYNTNSVYYYLADRDRNQLNASLTRHVSDWGGDHDFKFGMELERSGLRSRYGYPTGAKYYDNYYGYEDPGTGDPGYYSLAYIGNSYDIHATNGRMTAYVQDDWQITPRFTLNPGVRFDYIQGKVPNLGKVYDNINIAPRLGFAWNVTGDNRNLIKAHVGRYYAGARGVYYYWVDPGAFEPGRVDTLWESGAVDTGATRTKTFELDPNLNHPYMDQFTLGYDRALPMGMVISFTGIYRKWKDFVETVAANPDFTPVTGEVGVLDANGDYVSTGQTVTLYDWNNWDTDSLLITNPEGLEREYKGGMITLTKNFRNNWQALVSYVYSETTGTIDNVGFDAASDSGGQDAGPAPFLDTPNSRVNWSGNLTYDPTNQLKLQGSYVFPGINLWLSANYTYYTGTTYTKRSECLLVDDDADPNTPSVCHSFPQEGIARVRYFAEERGSRRLDPFNELNARVEWKPKIWKGQLGLILDSFNLLNDSRVTEVQDRDNGDFDLVTEHNIGRRFRAGVRFEF